MLQIGFLGKLKWFASAVKATKAFKALQFIGTIATLAVGVKGFLQARQMLAKGQDIMANKTAAGGKIPLIYGLRRVGAQIVYMDTKNNRSKDLFVVYAISVGECEEILGETIEIDGNSILDPNIYKAGGYVGSDKIASGSGSLCTASQVGDVTYSNAGTLGTDPTLRYSFVFNLHHGATSQTADPMLTASIPEAWTSSHKLNGICYIAAAFDYDKKGMYKGVPQITVQVKGKKVYDPRSDTTAWSSNAALCFLDYIQSDEYGKGLATADINMSTFEDAADACDVLQNQPYYGSSYQNVTWSGESGTKKICISNFDDAFQNKIDEVISIKDSLDTVIKSQETINEFKTNEFYDQTRDNCLILDTALTSDYTNEAGSIYAQVKRFTCNGYVDTNKNVMDNAKELLANMRGIFTYINGKYELQIEDTGSSTFSITDNHIISDAGISIDYGNKDKKANKVIVEFFNANKKYELDTVTEFHDATPNYYSDDGEILEIKAEFPYVTDPYIASNMAKAILGRSRNQTAIQFLGTPEMYKLNVGDIVDITYDGLDLSSTNNNNVFRIEALELQSNGLVSVSAIQYLDIYTWEVPTQEATADPTTPPTVGAIHPPDATSIVFTDTDASPIGRPTLTWTEPTDFPVRQYRVNVVDSNDVNVFSKIVDTPSVDLSYLAPASNYEAQITSFNGVGLESEAVTKTFTISDEPTRTEDIQDLAVTNAKINNLSADKIDTGVLNVGTESGMAVRQAKTGYTDTTTGFWLGNDSGTPKFNIGTSTDYFKFDGSSVDIAGDLTATNLTIEADATITGTLDASVITLDGQDLSTLISYGSISGQTGNYFGINQDLNLAGVFYWDAENGTSVFDLGTGGIDNVSLYFKTEAPIVFQDGAAALGTFELNFGDDDYVNYYNDYISLVADWTNAQQGTGDVTKFIIKGRSSDLTNAPKQNIASFEFSSADGFGSAKTVFNGQIETPRAVIEDYITIEQDTAPSTTTDKLYNVSGDLYWNGSELGVGAITSVTNMADNRVITASGSNSLNGEANLTFDGSTLDVTGTVTADSVGIGLDNPTRTLQIVSTGTTTGGTYLYSNAIHTGTDTQSLLSVRSDNASATGTVVDIRGDGTGDILHVKDGTNTALIVEDGGSVGIGTNSPNASLSIVKQATALSGTGNNYGLHLYPTSSGVVYVDAITNSTGNTDLRLRSYNNGTYNQLIGSSSGGTVTTFQTGGLERMRIDSSGRVGIGATPANSNLDITRSNALVASLNRSSGTGAVIDFRYNGTAKGNIGTNDITASDIYIATGDGSSSTSGVGLRFLNYLTTQNIYPSRSDGTVVDDVISLGTSGGAFKDLYLSGTAYVDTAVGIGTTSPSEKLTIAGDVQIGESSGGEKLKFVGASNKYNFLVGKQVNVDNAFEITPSTAAGGNTFSTPAVVVDSSGNLLVGKTATDIGTVGHQFLSDGQGDYAAHTSNGTRALLLNRKTSDGEIVDFRKDGTQVGSIGTVSGDLNIFASASGHKGLRLGAGFIAPTSNSTTIEDATTDLGISTARFRDLRLSRTGYFGTSVGIGTTSPDRPLDITDTTTDGSGGVVIHSYLPTLEMDDISGGGTSFILQHDGTNTLFKHDTSERMIIESTGLIRAVTSITSDPTNTNAYFYNKSGVGSTLSGYQFSVRTGATPSESYRVDNNGNLLVGKTSFGLSTDGVQLSPINSSAFTANDAIPLYTNRRTSDGDSLQFRTDGTAFGSIGNTGGAMYIGSPSGSDAFLLFTNNRVQPCTSTGANRDNIIDLGISSSRFDDIYATNGTINTSDINEKQDIEDLSEAETRVAVAAKGLLKKYRWKSAVADKGDDARIHFGIMAQDLQNAFANEGLDAGDYGMFISSTWTDEATGEEKTRLGVRYNELLAFIIAAI